MVIDIFDQSRMPVSVFVYDSMGLVWMAMLRRILATFFVQSPNLVEVKLFSPSPLFRYNVFVCGANYQSALIL